MLKGILDERNMNLTDLSRLSNIPYSTLHEIYTEKRDFKKCSIETGYKLATALNMDLNALYNIMTKESFNYEEFDLFKSEICHMVKNKGELGFIREMLVKNYIRLYWNMEEYEKAFYLLAMTDLLSKKNDIPIYNGYSDIRKYKLEREVYPFSAILEWNINKIKKQEIKEHYKKNATPEFLKYNIIESDIL